MLLDLFADGAWRSLVARIVRDDEVPGSNPGAPTILPTVRPCIHRPLA